MAHQVGILGNLMVFYLFISIVIFFMKKHRETKFEGSYNAESIYNSL